MAIFNGWQITRAGVVFVVGLIILIGLVFGGVWLARDRGEQARHQEATKLAEQQLQLQSETTPQTSTNSEPVIPEPSDSDDQTATVATPASGDLPETGADISHVVVLTLVTLAIAYYATSRRAVREL